MRYIFKWKKGKIRQPTNCYQSWKHPCNIANVHRLFLLARRSGRSHDGDTGQLAQPPALCAGQKADAVFPAAAANQQ